VKNGNPQVRGICSTEVPFVGGTFPFTLPYASNKTLDMTSCVGGITGPSHDWVHGDFYTVDILGFPDTTGNTDPIAICSAMVKVPMAHGANEEQNRTANRLHLTQALSDNFTITLQADGKCSLSGS